VDETQVPGSETRSAPVKPELAADLSGVIGPYLPSIKEGLHGVIDASGESATVFHYWPYLHEIACMISVGKSAEADTNQATWATGFAPYEKPEITVTVLVSGADRSRMAVSVFAEVISAYLDQRVLAGMLDAPLASYRATPGDGHISQEEAAAIALSALPYRLSSPELQFSFICNPKDEGTAVEYTWYVSVYVQGVQIYTVHLSGMDGHVIDVIEAGGLG